MYCLISKFTTGEQPFPNRPPDAGLLYPNLTWMIWVSISLLSIATKVYSYHQNFRHAASSTVIEQLMKEADMSHVKRISIPSGMKQIGKWYSLLQIWLCLPQQLPDLEYDQLELEQTDTANAGQRVISKEQGETGISSELGFASQS